MRFLIIVIAFCFFGGISAQVKDKTSHGAEIQFLKTTHDFGVVNEDINFAIHQFRFVNTGDRKLHITNVATSCGCTTPDWTKDSINPGDTGFVQAKYETTNRIGTFSKSITVYSNAVTSPFVQLNIIGDVHREKPQVNGIEIPDYGKVYFEPATIDFRPLFDNKVDTQFARLVNGTPFTTTFADVKIPENLTIIGLPKSLEPGETVQIMVILNGKIIKGYGFGAFQVPVSCDNPVSPDIGLFVAYQRRQFFPKMNSKQLAKAPKAKWDKEFHNFGNHLTGELMSTDFVVSNVGKSDLIFHEIFPECSCLTLKYPKNILKPGESMTIQLTYDSIAKKGTSNQSVWIVCNDPTRDEMRISIRAQLPEKEYHCPTCK
ncbi:MAG: DUF1573 domain-containing protein [Bacteroidetes bacterium]|nr:DUF1573 domain-containing protein [Bacteroidota bacterium]